MVDQIGMIFSNIQSQVLLYVYNIYEFFLLLNSVTINRWAEPRKFLYRIDDGIFVALFGIPSDCIFLLNNVMRKEALQYRLKFDTKISGQVYDFRICDT